MALNTAAHHRPQQLLNQHNPKILHQPCNTRQPVSRIWHMEGDGPTDDPRNLRSIHCKALLLPALCLEAASARPPETSGNGKSPKSPKCPSKPLPRTEPPRAARPGTHRSRGGLSEKGKKRKVQKKEQRTKGQGEHSESHHKWGFGGCLGCLRCLARGPFAVGAEREKQKIDAHSRKKDTHTNLHTRWRPVLEARLGAFRHKTVEALGWLWEKLGFLATCSLPLMAKPRAVEKSAACASLVNETSHAPPAR